MTLGCFFTCPLVKGGSTQPWPYHGNVVEAYCDDLIWYCGAAGNIVIYPNPWQVDALDDYIDPFQAIRSAAQLRFDVIADLQAPWYWIDACSRHTHQAIVKNHSNSRDSSKLNRQVSIGSDIELHVFEELCQHAVPAVTLGIDVLGSWDEKPWRLHQSLSMSRYANRSQPHVTDLWCAASGSWPIPPLMQCRLIDEHLSHTVGPVEPDEDGPADLDPQDLEVLFEEEDDLSFLLASFPHEDDPLITLEMYGLYITHHSIRSATTSGDIASIKETILRTWSDILPRHGLMNAFLLKPQDLIGVSIIQFLVEIVPPEIRIPAIDVPILRRTKWYSDDSTSIETAYMRDSQTGYELLIDAGHEGWCFHPRNIQCNLHIEGRIAFLSLRHPLRQGAVLSFFIHDDWVDPGVSADSHATSDETSLVGFPRWISSPVFVVSEGGSVASGIGGLKANSASGTSVPPTCSHETDKSPLMGTSVQDVVPTCQFRPNPDIRIPFDEDLPIVRHTEQGPIAIGRTIPPPNWSQSTLYRAASAAGSVSRTTHGQLFVRVRTWVVLMAAGMPLGTSLCVLSCL